SSKVGRMMRKPDLPKTTPPAVTRPPPPPPPPPPPMKVTTARRAPKTMGLIMGISRFKNLPEANQLEFTAKDATDFHRFLASASGGAVPTANLQLLRDSQANSRDVHLALRKLTDAAEAGDTVVVFAASHGIPNAMGKFDIVLHDTAFASKKAGGATQSLDMAVPDRNTTLTDEDVANFIAD